MKMSQGMLNTKDILYLLAVLFPTIKQVWWISCLLFISLKPFTRAIDLDPTSSSNPVNTTAESEEEKSQGDLDLETQDQVAILKQINRVNDDGSYTFGYEAADGSFKIETRDVNGNVKGMFGFINEAGELKRVSYSASNGTGFQSTGTLNIPPLPGTTADEEGQTFGNYQITRPDKKEEFSTKISLLESTTANYDTSQEIPSPRLPIYIYGSSTARNEVTSTTRPVVIQHIPKVRPTPATSSTAPTESEEIVHEPLYSGYVPQRTSNGNFISFNTNEITSTTPDSTTTEEINRQSSVIQVIRPRAGPYKKVIVTKRPIVTTTPKIVTTTEFQSKEYLEKLKGKDEETETGNGVRRQLGITNNYATPTQATNLLTSGTEDSPDVYGSGHTPRPYPTNAYRTLFTQIPQHQRILQNSYIQNQNQYLAAALGNPGLIPTVPPTVVPTPGQGRTYTGSPIHPITTVPSTLANNPPRQNYIPIPPDPQGQRQFPAPPNYVRPFSPAVPPIVPYQPEQPLYIPPGLLEQLIRMLIAAQHRQRLQPVSPFQQAVMATLGPGNVPPELLDSRYDPRYYQPYPNYSQAPYPVPMVPRPIYDPYYQPPGYLPGYNYQPMYSPIPYRFQPRVSPYEQGEDLAYRMLLGFPRFQAPIPVTPITNPTNVVERSPVYQPEMDSTTSSTTPPPRLGQVRNVQILGQISDDNENESTKSGE